MRRIILSVSCLLVLVLVVSGAAMAMDSRQQQENTETVLEAMLLQPQEYPQGAQELTRGPVTADDQSHPVNRFHAMLSENSPESLFDYVGAYELSLVVADGQGGAFAGYYLYAYADAKQAQSSADAILKAFATAQEISADEQITGTSVQGTSRMFIASEGDSIYYFVGTQDNVLTLFVVDGMSETTQATYETLLKDFVSR